MVNYNENGVKGRGKGKASNVIKGQSAKRMDGTRGDTLRGDYSNCENGLKLLALGAAC